MELKFEIKYYKPPPATRKLNEINITDCRPFFPDNMFEKKICNMH
jgi:hypothetical protein